MFWICFGILMLIPIIDLTLKKYVEKHVTCFDEIQKLGGRVRIRYVQNKGMALNILDKFPALVRILSLVIIVPASIYYIWLMQTKGRGFEKVSLSLLLGGAFSNLYDRFHRHYVVDYFGFQTKWEKLTRITYNLGDMAIFAGVIGMVLQQLFEAKR